MSLYFYFFKIISSICRIRHFFGTKIRHLWTTWVARSATKPRKIYGFLSERNIRVSRWKQDVTAHRDISRTEERRPLEEKTSFSSMWSCFNYIFFKFYRHNFWIKMNKITICFNPLTTWGTRLLNIFLNWNLCMYSATEVTLNYELMHRARIDDCMSERRKRDA